MKRDAPEWVCRESAYQDRAYCRRFGDAPGQCDAVVRHFIGDRVYSRDVTWLFLRDLVQQYFACFSIDDLKNTSLVLKDDLYIVGVRNNTSGYTVSFIKPLKLWGRASKLGIR